MQRGNHRRKKRVVCPRHNRQSYAVNVFLYGRSRDHFRGLVQASVHHLEAGIAQSAGNDLGAPVMAIEARLGNQNPDFALRHFISCT